MRILSGMQPSGNPHLGNYLGAMKQHIELQEKNECFYFIANYHALTTVRDGQKLRDMTFELAVDYLALGLNPDRTTFFRQSDVPEVTELAWIFSCLTSMGLLERCHAWKDAKTKGKKEASAGLFTYPVLMSADILIYQSELVPVGKDQKQHVEVARDIAMRFNNLYGETFRLPEPQIKKEVATVPGIDGEKMSKSYGNTIDIFAPENEIKKKVMSIVTDSTPLEKPKNPETCTVFMLYKLLATEKEASDLAKKYQKGNFGYGDAKKLLLEKILETFRPYRKKRDQIIKNPDYVEKVLQTGALRARKIAAETLKDVRKKTGL